jgi:hypothetical protein
VRAHPREELAVARAVEGKHDGGPPVGLSRVGLAVGVRHLREALVELAANCIRGRVRLWLGRGELAERRVHDKRVEVGTPPVAPLRPARPHEHDASAALAQHVLHERRRARAARAVHDHVRAGLGAGQPQVRLERRLELPPRHVLVHSDRDGRGHVRGEDRVRLHARAADRRLAIGLLAILAREHREDEAGSLERESRARVGHHKVKRHTRARPGVRLRALQEAAAAAARASVCGESTL